MSAYNILKAVELDGCSAKFKKEYPDLQALQAGGWLLQRKYDGCFGMAVVREDRNSDMLSRTGEDYSASCGHLLAEVAEAITEWRGSGWAIAIVLGEVWHPTWGFPTISGKFRKRAPCGDLRFAVNDILPAGLVTRQPYTARHTEVMSIFGHPGDPALRTFGVEAEAGDAWEKALKWQGQGGFDGAILRDPLAPYTIGVARAGQIIKVKPTLSLDLRVTDVLRGEGKYAHTAGALRCSLGAGGTVDVGTGLTDRDRDEFFYRIGPEIRAGRPVIVEVEAMGWSTEGKLREPRYKGIRHDKLTPDR